MAQLQSVFLVFTKTLVLLISLHHVSSLVTPTSTSTITTLSKHNNVTDRQALLDFQSMISNGVSAPPTSWNDSTHFCQWLGVTCSGRRHPQRVISLNLSSLDLGGVISPAITNLTFLRKMDLSNNQFHGHIPQEIGHLVQLKHLNLSQNSLDGEYGVANKVSVHGDVYSYGILLLEMFTAKRPTDDMFKDGQSLRQFVESAFPERIVDVMDANLFVEEDGEASDDAHNLNASRIMECVASVFRVGILCSHELPAERMEMKEIVSELHKIRDVFSKNETQGERQNRAH